MKKIFLIILIFANIANINARVFTNNVVDPMIVNSSVILDGSTAFSAEAGSPNNVGAGIVLPSVDLINFEFDISLADGITFPTFFDGMIVYNRSTGTTLTAGNRSSTAIEVEPGFYYFSNPNGATNFNVTGGIWKPLGSGSGSSASSKGEAFWLPSFSLPWATITSDPATEIETVDLFNDIYQPAFGGTRSAAPTYYTSEGANVAVVVPGHEPATTSATDFYYVIAQYDPAIIEIQSLTDAGVFTYKKLVPVPTYNAFIKILMVWK